ncbi:MAG: metallophosphoesterase [Gemmatimonadaceae bacterium]|nr:metallophosphoesterase [Gemmatimonadaceae bacterium]
MTVPAIGRALLLAAALLSVQGCGGAADATPSPTQPAPAPVPPTGSAGGFTGSVVLGSPTATSIRANVYAPTQGGTVELLVGTAPNLYTVRSAATPLIADRPVELALDNLQPGTRYFYRLQLSGATTGYTAEASFRTAARAGQAFRFGIQGDSHPERERSQFDAGLYTRTLTAAAADSLDFYVMLGDDFSIDNLNPATITAAQVRERYTLQRPYLGVIGAMSPVFLVNGNHEQAAQYLLDGTPNNPAVWAQTARNSLYSQPAPDAFYSGNSEVVPNIGLLRNYYAFTWGDALFVMIDPYWGSPVCVDNPFFGGDKRSDLWTVTHGDAQYQWLKTTLERSTAKYKFVFAHHVMGTGRGGIEVARLYEWGGRSPNGATDFAAKRPTWAAPIHQLFVTNKVTAFFQGHDHIWVQQQLDGVIYQSLSEPADPNYSLFNADAYDTGVKFPNSGYTRVSVAPTGVTVEYIRMYRAADEGAGRTSGTVAYRYTIP